jgi:hypothetical protein
VLHWRCSCQCSRPRYPKERQWQCQNVRNVNSTEHCSHEALPPPKANLLDLHASSKLQTWPPPESSLKEPARGGLIRSYLEFNTVHGFGVLHIVEPSGAVEVWGYKLRCGRHGGQWQCGKDAHFTTASRFCSHVSRACWSLGSRWTSRHLPPCRGVFLTHLCFRNLILDVNFCVSNFDVTGFTWT